jgi:hypothetical protein
MWLLRYEVDFDGQPYMSAKKASGGFGKAVDD